MQLLTLLWQMPICWGLERLTARTSLKADRQLRALSFVIVVLPVGVVITDVLRHINVILPSAPLLTLDRLPLLSGHPFLATISAAIASVLITDLAYYWAHRAQHSVPLLWRFHSLHHSIRDLSAVNNYSHWTEGAVMLLLKTLPVAFLIRFNGELGVWLGALLKVHQSYIHSNSKINFGRWSWLINDNVRHRIHHSLEPRHFDKNFSIDFGIWDHLFGTAYVPARGEWPDTGLEDQQEPQNIRKFFLWSFDQRPSVLATSRTVGDT
jgi:sterol desaturase/sphingolipid hydroxylase (fatty acid hydroxylase superfamily)